MRSSQFSISFSQLLMRCSYSMISCLLLCSSADRSSNSEAKSLALSDQDSSQSQSYLFWADKSRQRVLRWSLSPQRMMFFKSSFSFYVSSCFILNCTFVQFSQRCSLSVQLGCSLSKNSEMSTWVSISSLGGCSDRRCSISAFNYWFSAVSILMEWMCSWFSSMNILTLSNISCLSSQMSAGMIQHWHSMLMLFSTCSSRWISARMSPFLSSALTLLREISLLSSSILDLYMSIISMHSRSSLLYLLWYSSSFSLYSCSLLSISSFSCLTISSYLANFQLSLISGLIVCSVCELWSYFRGSSRDSSMMLLSISRLRLILSTICLISKTEEQPWNLSSSTDSGLSLNRVVSSIIFSSLVFSLLNISLLSLAVICTFSFSLAFSIASSCSLLSLSPLALAVSFCFSATSLFRTQFWLFNSATSFSLLIFSCFIFLYSSMRWLLMGFLALINAGSGLSSLTNSNLLASWSRFLEGESRGEGRKAAENLPFLCWRCLSSTRLASFWSLISMVIFCIFCCSCRFSQSACRSSNLARSLRVVFWWSSMFCRRRLFSMSFCCRWYWRACVSSFAFPTSFSASFSFFSRYQTCCSSLRMMLECKSP